MEVNYSLSNKGLQVPQSNLIRAKQSVLESLGTTNNFIFDLDDTIAVYDPGYIRGILFSTFKDHTYKIDDQVIEEDALELHKNMHYGHAQKLILEKYFDDEGIRNFWDSFTALFHQSLNKEHVTFDPRLVKFINFIIRNSLESGVISNSSESAGTQVLDYLKDKSNIELHEKAVFLGSSSERKPNPKALVRYEEHIGAQIDISSTAYIGNSISDLIFAKNIGVVPVLIDYEDSFSKTQVSDKHKDIISDSVTITNFASIKNHIERVRPNYRRQISFLVEKSLSENESIENSYDICLEPTEENIFRIANEATAKVVEHVPYIFRRFNEKFSNKSTFSVTDIPNYRSFFHEITGAVLIPNPEHIENEYYKNYFNNMRYRVEGDRFYTRGPAYYRHYVPEFKHEYAKQNDLVFSEIMDCLDVLGNTYSDTRPEVDSLIRLAVMDNLRGNLQSLFLSTINSTREGDVINDLQGLLEISDKAKYYYEKSVELQYSFMLGIDTDEREIINELRNIESFSKDYVKYSEDNNYPLRHKNPEVDNQLLIAVRANEICNQYPDTEVFLGLSSGGVELAAVSNLISEKIYGNKKTAAYLPISTHHGLSMWQKDKPELKIGEENRSLLNLDSLVQKNIVICEDNSNSGQTLQRVSNLLGSLNAKNVNFAVIEIDPTRIILHSVQQKSGAKHNIGETAKRVRPIANYFHPDFIGAVDVVKILPGDNGFAKIIAMDTANKSIK